MCAPLSAALVGRGGGGRQERWIVVVELGVDSTVEHDV